MPCMNLMSAAEGSGSVALVVDGRVRVGFPGAPGWTTTGGALCCAWTATASNLARVPPAAKMHEQAATLNAIRIPKVHLRCGGLTYRKYDIS
jgi:hypothetical protein